MTRSLSITKRQAKTLLQAANEEGGIVEVVTEIGVVRLIPAALAPKPEPAPVDKEPKGYL